MKTTIGVQEWMALLSGAIAEIKGAHQRLSELDSACGDGDHGTTMLRAANLLEKCIAEGAGKDMQSFLNDAAWALLGLDGGATGSLLGSFFLGIAEAVESRTELDARSLAQCLAGGLSALMRQSRAQVGDKSMLDALAPAIAAIRRAADDGQPLPDALRAAAVAAEQGAASTKDLVAKVGRAKYLGTKTLGTPDPGATSVALLFRGFYKGFEALRP